MPPKSTFLYKLALCDLLLTVVFGLYLLQVNVFKSFSGPYSNDLNALTLKVFLALLYYMLGLYILLSF